MMEVTIENFEGGTGFSRRLGILQAYLTDTSQVRHDTVDLLRHNAFPCLVNQRRAEYSRANCSRPASQFAEGDAVFVTL